MPERQLSTTLPKAAPMREARARGNVPLLPQERTGGRRRGGEAGAGDDGVARAGRLRQTHVFRGITGGCLYFAIMQAAFWLKRKLIARRQV